MDQKEGDRKRIQHDLVKILMGTNCYQFVELDHLEDVPKDVFALISSLCAGNQCYLDLSQLGRGAKLAVHAYSFNSNKVYSRQSHDKLASFTQWEYSGNIKDITSSELHDTDALVFRRLKSCSARSRLCGLQSEALTSGRLYYRAVTEKGKNFFFGCTISDLEEVYVVKEFGFNDPLTTCLPEKNLWALGSSFAPKTVLPHSDRVSGAHDFIIILEDSRKTIDAFQYNNIIIDFDEWTIEKQDATNPSSKVILRLPPLQDPRVDSPSLKLIDYVKKIDSKGRAYYPYSKKYSEAVRTGKVKIGLHPMIYTWQNNVLIYPISSCGKISDTEKELCDQIVKNTSITELKNFKLCDHKGKDTSACCKGEIYLPEPEFHEGW